MNLITSQPAKFTDPERTADGKARARVDLRALRTVWFNTGTLCNLSCANCYIESSPTNDALVYLSRAEVAAYLEEIARYRLPVTQIGFTGGEPFMNPEFTAILQDTLEAGFEVLILTNAMRPMMKCADALRALQAAFPAHMTVRVSLDHYDRALHEQERGRRSWQPGIDGLRWLARQGFRIRIAARTRWGDDEHALRAGFARLFAALELPLDARDTSHLMLFPEMQPGTDVPEITTECWSLLNKDPGALMCADSRMVVKHKGAATPHVVACTLLPFEPGFALGNTLTESADSVALNHPHCARFCVLGGGSCTTGAP